jgi:ParB family chromosome partitioning protein
VPAKTFGLGRGLESLLPKSNDNPAKGVETYISLAKLKANPMQPRQYFDEAALNELASSIKEHGIIEPLIVEENDDGSYLVIAGERRMRAAKLAGLTEAPALIRSYSDEKKLEVALIENIQREDLNPIEEAMAYKNLMELTGLSQEAAAVKVGKSRPALTNALRLLKLPIEIQASLKENKISAGHARAILSLEAAETQLALFRAVLAEGLSVRETESRAGKELSTGKAKPAEKGGAKEGGGLEGRGGSAARDPQLKSLEDRFTEKFSAKVKIDGTLEQGVLHIEYYSASDLDRFCEIISI